MTHDRSDPVRATLSFVVDTGEKPVNYPSEAGGREERDEGTEDRRDVDIHNARLESPGCELDVHGFGLLEQAQPEDVLVRCDGVLPAVASGPHDALQLGDVRGSVLGLQLRG